jgi:hypothetical protein
MPHRIDSKQPARVPRARLLAAATLVIGGLVIGALMAGCGASSSSTISETVDGATTATASTSSAHSAPPGVQVAGLAFARCMRANGVANFPDPQPGRGLLFNASGVDMAAPAVKAAQAKCKRLLGAGGPANPGSTTHPTPQTLAKLVKIARCMRQHGISEFPDPTTSVPSNPSALGINQITDFDGAILLFPSTLNVQAPAYSRALNACGAPPLGLPH